MLFSIKQNTIAFPLLIDTGKYEQETVTSPKIRICLYKEIYISETATYDNSKYINLFLKV